MSSEFTRLIHTHNDTHVGEYPLAAERTTIGRHADNTIQISDPAISAHHAVILMLDGVGTVLRDLDSTNGTYVNGRSVTEQTLRNGDVVSIGHHKLKYVEARVVDADDGRTVLMRRPAPAAGHAVPPTAILRTLTGPRRGGQTILSRPNTAVGEEGGQRAVIKRRSTGYHLIPLWGDVSPTVNGNPVGVEGCELKDRDVIRIAGVELEFLLG